MNPTRKDDLNDIDLYGATWHKSSFSNGGENCVEFTGVSGGVALRDSKRLDLPVLRYTAEEWSAFRNCIIEGTI
ncbi:DUF397 domain-containing protein [Streptomyces sp. NPDC050804]|uniref:DUF397 domain-containing protein n=1 Tax=unclassified Streptomyces TaxID=2593676 RepID=UPI00343A730B|nr:DUF397 domain-containing protein [Streptomyces sp. NBC_00872]